MNCLWGSFSKVSGSEEGCTGCTCTLDRPTTYQSCKWYCRPRKPFPACDKVYLSREMVFNGMLSTFCVHEAMPELDELVNTGFEKWIRETKSTTLFTVADIPTLPLSFIDFTYSFRVAFLYCFWLCLGQFQAFKFTLPTSGACNRCGLLLAFYDVKINKILIAHSIFI